ncbi:hypothetical protein RRG08_020962 [Elysia crispata]|uniref:Uncharacterized protein n=1 Tax=Elysia crispata TaxID=231223 RepID=A0AAE1B806_9GAST|nr:hypothetical protein RRG08_020962 [Elysia crispata]
MEEQCLQKANPIVSTILQIQLTAIRFEESVWVQSKCGDLWETGSSRRYKLSQRIQGGGREPVSSRGLTPSGPREALQWPAINTARPGLGRSRGFSSLPSRPQEILQGG